jgi:hypothetical protein
MTSKNSPVNVLGKTFNSEEERRTYFREELRLKLPELKLMEGFPIGEDEDILNLSDPPYYTACPNPWLNDFIAEWEAEKKELEKQGLRKADFEVTEPYAADVSEGKIIQFTMLIATILRCHILRLCDTFCIILSREILYLMGLLVQV